MAYNPGSVFEAIRVYVAEVSKDGPPFAPSSLLHSSNMFYYSRCNIVASWCNVFKYAHTPKHAHTAGSNVPRCNRGSVGVVDCLPTILLEAVSS